MEDLKNKGRRLNWRQACEILGCGKTRFYALIRKGMLPAYRVTGGKRGLWVYESECQGLVRCITPTSPQNETKDGEKYTTN